MASASPTEPPPARQKGLRARLTKDARALRELIGRPRPRGVALCGLDVLGHGPGELYAWVACADYRTGLDAEQCAGSSEPVVVRPDRFVFPRQAFLDEDIDRLFPPDVAHAIRYRDVHPKPSLDQLLVTARGLPGGPECSGAS